MSVPAWTNVHQTGQQGWLDMELATSSAIRFAPLSELPLTALALV